MSTPLTRLPTATYTEKRPAPSRPLRSACHCISWRRMHSASGRSRFCNGFRGSDERDAVPARSGHAPEVGHGFSARFPGEPHEFRSKLGGEAERAGFRVGHPGAQAVDLLLEGAHLPREKDAFKVEVPG